MSRCVVRRACVLFLTIFLPVAGFADGIVIPQRAYALPRIPDQQALIHYAQGTETLVIETSFAGQGTNFAWIVPLPAEARIEAVSPGLFSTLQIIFQPGIVTSVRHWWLALPVAAFLAWVVNLWRRGEAAAALLLLGISVLVTLLFLPAFSPAVSRGGMEAPARARVRVLSRRNVGSFDTALIKSTDPTALLSWLNENGFSTPTNIVPVVADYVREGWVFAAARFKLGAGEAASTATHPLSFTFKTARPVYPLRLTAKGTDACRIDLYVFGPRRATAPGFNVERCEMPEYGTQVAWPAFEAGVLRIRNKELAGFADRAPVATRLSAVLGANAMERDLYIDWNEYRASGQRQYAPTAALMMSGNFASFVFIALVAAKWGLAGAGNETPPRSRRVGYWLAAGAATAGLLCYLGLPKADAASFRMARGSFSIAKFGCFEMAIALGEEMADRNAFTNAAPARPLSGGELARLLQAVGRDYEHHWSAYPGYRHPLTNIFTGESIRFEASPGNFVLRPAASGPRSAENSFARGGPGTYELVWHDFDGAEMYTNPVPGF